VKDITPSQLLKAGYNLIPEASENGQKAIRSLTTGARNESNLSLLRAGRKNALDLSLEPAPKVETLPLAGQPGVVFKDLANVLAAYPKSARRRWSGTRCWTGSRTIAWST
jgi:hypothetical protein